MDYRVSFIFGPPNDRGFFALFDDVCILSVYSAVAILVKLCICAFSSD